MLKRGKLISFGDVIIMDRRFHSYKNYLRIRYDVAPLIISREKWRNSLSVLGRDNVRGFRERVIIIRI